jgi:hypothetical protein
LRWWPTIVFQNDFAHQQSRMLLGGGRRQCHPSTRRFVTKVATRSYQQVDPPCLIDVSKRPDGWKETNATVYHRVIDKPLGNDLALALGKAFKL